MERIDRGGGGDLSSSLHYGDGRGVCRRVHGVIRRRSRKGVEACLERGGQLAVQLGGCR